MSPAPDDIGQLAALPKVDREILIEETVIRLFKAQLFMDDAEELSVDENYFDLGLGSLQLTEVQERLEQRFACEIDTVLLFNNPTVAHLLEHLDVLITRTGGAERG